MTIRPLRPSDLDEFVRMRGSLWPDPLASEVENTDSQAFHLAAGFEEVHRSICFKRSLNPVSS
jgi:hypothetical protein